MVNIACDTQITNFDIIFFVELLSQIVETSGGEALSQIQTSLHSLILYPDSVQVHFNITVFGHSLEVVIFLFSNFTRQALILKVFVDNKALMCLIFLARVAEAEVGGAEEKDAEEGIEDELAVEVAIMADRMLATYIPSLRRARLTPEPASAGAIFLWHIYLIAEAIDSALNCIAYSFV